MEHLDIIRNELSKDYPIAVIGQLTDNEWSNFDVSKKGDQAAGVICSQRTGIVTIKDFKTDTTRSFNFREKEPPENKQEAKVERKPSTRLKTNLTEADKEDIKKREKERKIQVNARIFNGADPAKADHPVLKHKKITDPPEEWKQKGIHLYVPIIDSKRSFASLQTLTLGTDGKVNKRSAKGCNVKGMVTSIKGDGEVVYVAEGELDSYTVNAATKCQTYSCISIYNLKKAILTIKKLSPKKRLIICVDNDSDRLDADGEPENIGVIKSLETAITHNCNVAIPSSKNIKGSIDFDDIRRDEGSKAVKLQLGNHKPPAECIVDLAAKNKSLLFTEPFLKISAMLINKNPGKHEKCKMDLKRIKFPITPWEKLVKSTAKEMGKEKKLKNNPEHSDAALFAVKKWKGRYGIDSITGLWLAYSEGAWRDQTLVKIEAAMIALIAAHPKVFPKPYPNPYLVGVLKQTTPQCSIITSNSIPDLLFFDNMVLNSKTMETMEHSPSFGNTRIFNHPYEPNAPHQVITDWLYLMLGKSDDLLQLIRAFFYAVITSMTEVHRFLELIGPAGAGKSTIIWILTQMVGALNVYATEFFHLEKNRFEVASIVKCMLALISDSGTYEGGVGVLKQLTGGDLMRSEAKMIQPENGAKNSAMFIVAANEPIRSNDYTSGLGRRRMTIHLENVIPLPEQIKMKPIFKPHIKSLFPWALGLGEDNAYKILKAQGSPIQRASWLKNLLATNNIADWMHCYLIYAPESKERIRIGLAKQIDHQNKKTVFEDYKKKLYPSYCQYCVDRRIKPKNQKSFSYYLQDLIEQQLKLKNLIKDKDRTSAYCSGMQFRTIDHDEDALSPPEAAALSNEGEV